MGQSRFVKTVGDIHEAPVQNICENKFGVAFYEASDVMASLARDRRGDEQASPSNALALFFGQVLNAIKTVPEVCTIRRATANPIEVVIVETEPERGILRIIDRSKSKGIEMKAASLGVTLWQVGL